MFFTGIIIAVMALAIIGVFHPIVIKTEYYTGVRYWWVFMLLGLLCLAAALFVEDIIGSAALGLAGASFLWSILELFEQRERVRKGWFPMNPKRKDEYDKEKAQPLVAHTSIATLHHKTERQDKEQRK